MPLRRLALAASLLAPLAFSGCGDMYNGKAKSVISAHNKITRVAGTLVDEQGQPVDDVTVVVRTTAYGYDNNTTGWPYQTAMQKFTVNHDFHLTFQPPAADVRLIFSKPGVTDQQQVLFFTRTGPNDQPDSATGFGVDPTTGERTGVQVVLRPAVALK